MARRVSPQGAIIGRKTGLGCGDHRGRPHPFKTISPLEAEARINSRRHAFLRPAFGRQVTGAARFR